MAGLWPAFAQACAQHGLRTLPWALVNTSADIVAAVEAVGLPLASRPLAPVREYCAMLAEYPADAEFAFVKARAQSAGGAVIFSRHCAGPVFAVTAFPRGQAWEVFGPVEMVLRKKHALTPIEFLYPADIAPEAARQMRQFAGAVLKEMPPATASAVIEFVLTPEGPMAVFARDTISSKSPIRDARELGTEHGAACVCYLSPETGRVECIRGAEDALAMPGVARVEFVAKPGDSLRHVTSIAARDAAGHVIATGANAAEARKRARAAAARIEIVTSVIS